MKTFTRLLSLFLSLCLVAGTLPMNALAAEAMDFAGSFEEGGSAQDSENSDILTGDGSDPTGTGGVEAMSADGDAGGTAEVTRGEWISELVTLFGLTAEVQPDMYFPDIEGTAYYDAIMTATMCGMIDVEAGDPFEPDGALTQGFAAKTLNYRLGLQPKTESADPDAQVAIERKWFGGTYSEASPVTAAQSTAMIGDARAILENRVVTTPVSNFAFAENVVRVPDSAEVSVQKDIVQITGFSDISQGDVFAFFEQGLAFVYTAKEVRTEGDTLYITKEEAPEGSVTNAEFAGEIVPELSFTPDENVVTLMDSDGEPVVFGAARAVNIGKDSIKVTRDITLGDGVTGSLNIDLTHVRLQPQLQGSIKSFLLVGDLDVTATVKISLSDEAAKELALGELSLGSFGYAALVINLELEAEMSYIYTAEFGLGVEYYDWSFHNISYCTAKGSSLTAHGKAAAHLSLVGYLDFGVIGVANASIGIGPVVNVRMKTIAGATPETCVTIAGYLDARAHVYAQFANLDPYRKDWNFYTEKNSPIRTYEHIEDGVTVYSCTRGGSEKTAKYITPAGSRFYTSGNRNGSSSGTGSGGTSVPIWSIKANNDGKTAAITGYSGGGSVLSIPETVDGYTITSIGSRAFQNNKSIRVVTIPDKVTEIGPVAFDGCSNLQTVDFGDGLITIGYRAFAECSSLTAANLPEGLQVMGRGSSPYHGGVFYGCSALSQVYIPASLETGSGRYFGNFANCPKLNSVVFGEGITVIADYLFSDCTSLTHIEIPETVTEIKYCAFYGCTGLTNVKIPDAVTTIGRFAFEKCSKLETADFGDGLTSMEYRAFAECSSLADVILPEGLQEMGQGYTEYRGGVFYGCSELSHVHIPASLENGRGKYFGNFANCPKLDNITFGEGTTVIADYLFSDCTSMTHIEIPETVTEIHDYAFYGCTNLTTVKIPDAVTTIGEFAFERCSKLGTVDFGDGLTSMEYRAFAECTSLADVILPEGLQEMGQGYTEYRGGVFYGCSELSHVHIPASLENGRGKYFGNFANCPKLDNITFGEGTTVIADYLFSNCTSMTHIEIPKTVTEIHDYAFYGCTGLTTVKIPNETTVIGRYAFEDCTKLQTAELGKKLNKIGYRAFADCTSLKEITLPEGLQKLGDGYSGYIGSVFYNCSALEKVTLPTSLPEIYTSTFQGCTSLKSIDLPDNITTLGSSAFRDSGLTSIKTGAGLKTIGVYCFQDCLKLTDVTLNEGLSKLNNYAFKGCETLQTINLPDTVTSIGTYAFQACAALTDVTLSKSITTIPQYAFANCSSLATIELPKGVKTIDAYAFYQDTSLANVTIPQTVTSIGNNAFSYPKRMTVRGCAGSYAEEWATTNGSTFVDITKGITALSLANGTDRMTIGSGYTVTPMFTVAPENTTDIITLTSDNENVVSITDGTALRGRGIGKSANITATSSSGKTYTFTVNVSQFSGIEIGHLPNITSYGLKEDMNLDGLVVNAVFSDGSKEMISGYTVTGFDTDTTGVKTVTVTYSYKTATFEITVAKSESGTMTNPASGTTIDWAYNNTAQTVTISGTVPAGEQVFVAQYDGDGRFLKADTVQQGMTVNVSGSREVQIIWVTSRTYAPVCESKRISQ